MVQAWFFIRRNLHTFPFCMLLLVVIIEAQDKSSYIQQQPPQIKQYTAPNVAG